MGARLRIHPVRGLIVLIAAAVATVSVLATVRARAAGTPAGSVALNLPTAAVPLPSGGFLIADSKNNVVREVDASGEISTVAGDGQDNAVGGEPDPTGDGGPATSAELDNPTDAVPLPGGGFLIADATNTLGGGGGLVRKVSPSGIITTVAGGAQLVAGNYQVCAGATDALGDGCPATQANLADPTAAVPLSGGGILIADAGDQLVREVSPTTNKISIVAGGSGSCTGSDGLGNGCTATDVQLGFVTAAIPYNIAGAAVGTSGSGFLIADEQDCVVRYVDGYTPSAKMFTVAGTTVGCTSNFGSSSGKANTIPLNQPTDARPTADGGFLIADAGNCRVLKVSKTGDLTTVVPPPEELHPTQPNPQDCGDTNISDALIQRNFTAAIPTPDGGFLSTTATDNVYKVSSTGKITVVAGLGASGTGGTPTCSLKIKSAKVLLKKPKGKKGKKAKVDVVTLTATCNQAASVTLSGTFTEKQGKHKTKKFHASVTKTVAAGVPITLTVKLPGGAVKALKQKRKESAGFALAGTNSNGTGHAAASIKRVRGVK